MPVLNSPPLAVAECGVGPLFVQVTVSPVLIVIVEGAKLKSAIVTPPLAAAMAFGWGAGASSRSSARTCGSGGAGAGSAGIAGAGSGAGSDRPDAGAEAGGAGSVAGGSLPGAGSSCARIDPGSTRT